MSLHLSRHIKGWGTSHSGFQCKAHAVLRAELGHETLVFAVSQEFSPSEAFGNYLDLLHSPGIPKCKKPRTNSKVIWQQSWTGTWG